MNIRLFNRKYWIRSFEEAKEVKGYLYSPHSDRVESLHIHVLGRESIMALPEGERSIKRLEGHGEVKLQAANQDLGIKGDLLFYDGDWYECVSCDKYDHTLLSHYNYQFTIVPHDSSGATDLEPPTEEPE